MKKNTADDALAKEFSRFLSKQAHCENCPDPHEFVFSLINANDTRLEYEIEEEQVDL